MSRIYKRTVNAVELRQFGICSLFNDAATLQNDDLIYVANGREAVSLSLLIVGE